MTRLEYSKWYTRRFHTIKPEWYIFPARVGTPATGKRRPLDPTKPMVTLKTSWNNAQKKAKLTRRWHDNPHTLITDLPKAARVTKPSATLPGTSRSRY